MLLPKGWIYILKRSAPEGLVPWYGPMEQFLKDCTLWKAHIGSVLEQLDHVRGFPHWNKEEDNEEGVTAVKCCVLTITSIPDSSPLLEVGR